MKKIFFLAGIIMGVLFSAAFAQTYITQVKPVESKHWGYANQEGKLIIPAQYGKCYPFSEDGYATIYDSKMKQHFFINTQGEKLITEIGSFGLHHGIGYSLDGFHDGLVAIQWGERWGFMNASGKIAIPARYDFVTEFYDGHAVGKIGSTYAVLDAKGGASVVHEKDILEVRHFTENLAPYRAFDKLFGFIGVDGKIAIPARYETVGYFRGGLAWVEVDSGSFGYINTKGEWAIPPQFKAAKNFDPVSGRARVKTAEGVWAYANKSGELLYVKDTDSMGDFSEGLSEGKKGNKKGFYDNTGKWVIEPKFDGVRDFKNGYAAAKMDDKWGIIDKTGKWVIEPKFDGIKDMELVK